MTSHVVARVGEIPPGARKLVVVQGREFGIFNLEGQFRALRNLCPHQGGPLCRGTLFGTTLPSEPGVYRFGRVGEVLRCPWHGWEFDLLTGCALFDPKVRVRIFPIEVRGDELRLIIRPLPPSMVRRAAQHSQAQPEPATRQGPCDQDW